MPRLMQRHMAMLHGSDFLRLMMVMLAPIPLIGRSQVTMFGIEILMWSFVTSSITLISMGNLTTLRTLRLGKMESDTGVTLCQAISRGDIR